MPSPLGDLSFVWPFYAAFLVAYLVGSIPFGLVLTKLAGLGDIRRIGSGSIGATNVLRTGRKGLAALTLILDGGKGTAAVLAAGTMGPDMAVLAGAGVLIGHCFPVWLRFKGGKGVATALGVLLGIAPAAGAVACLTWLAVAAVFRYSSLASLTALALAPAYVWYGGDKQQVQLAAFIAAVVYLRHAPNILRLIRGEESKISFRATKSDG
ncbi:MAG: glycerol-3-phosphate 1-O-acyltransferase PlsY [Proteobacteria bacterium]|nr:glycerol-3-phosphate 1-O-acyltransferase PlsY [Pseudomonadota bacterium]MBI3497686.1 glycerol-3-phosphate 1-O-acyltransferase PlsY [Pseudomonadota bacterium]